MVLTEAASSGNSSSSSSNSRSNSDDNQNSNNNPENNNNNNNSGESPNSQYECNICLDVARDAVISMCGHLFCWPCLHKWLETRPNMQTCPVCKSAISKEKVIPLYGRNCTDKQDPRDKIPPRPQGQRTEAPRNNLFGFGLEGLQVSFGIGAFPFSFFASTFNLSNDARFPAREFFIFMSWKINNNQTIDQIGLKFDIKNIKYNL